MQARGWPLVENRAFAGCVYWLRHNYAVTGIALPVAGIIAIVFTHTGLWRLATSLSNHDMALSGAIQPFVARSQL